MALSESTWVNKEFHYFPFANLHSTFFVYWLVSLSLWSLIDGFPFPPSNYSSDLLGNNSTEKGLVL